jgi:predicted DNA-binding transcriptional regulator AlpA
MTANTPASTKQRGMGRDELLALPATVSVVTAARALGIGHNKAYELIKSGAFPVPTIPLGSTVRIPTASLWEVLGVSKDQV